MKSTEKIARYWDEIQSRRQNYDAQAEELHQVLLDNQASRVLDIGCGTGSLLIRLARWRYECTGLDMDGAMLAEAKKKAGREKLAIEFEQRDIKNMVLEKKFDVVTCFQVISLLAYPGEVKAALESINKILTPRGLFIFDVLSRDPADTAEAANPGPAVPILPPPFIDAALDKGKARVVRLNRMMMAESSQEWQAIYFFAEGGKVEIAVQNVPLKVYTVEEIETLLQEAGFTILSLRSHEAGGVKRRNLQIYACPVHSAARGAVG